jgi:hypothetical protein
MGDYISKGEPMRSSTETLIAACKELAATVQSDDGVANSALMEIAERLEELSRYAYFNHPIETAPKDGTKILVCTKDGECGVAHWGQISMAGDMGWQVSVVSTDWNYYEYISNPRYWMPLPKVVRKE